MPSNFYPTYGNDTPNPGYPTFGNDALMPGRPGKGTPFTPGNPATMGLYPQQGLLGGNRFTPGATNPWANPNRFGQNFLGFAGLPNDMNAQRIYSPGISRGPKPSMMPQAGGLLGGTPGGMPRTRSPYGR